MAIVDAFREDTLLAYATGVQPEITVPLNGESVLLGQPLSMTGSSNTQVTLTGTGVAVEGFKDVYVGQVALIYNRLDLSVLFKGITPLFKVGVTSKATTLHGWLDEFSELYGVKLYPEDVANVDLTTVGLMSVEAVALPTSLNYTGKFTISIYVPPIDIADLEAGLDIFVDNIAKSDFIYARQGSVTTVLPVNGARLTSGVDFTPFRADIIDMVSTGFAVAANRTNLGKIMRTMFGLPLDTVSNTSMTASPTDMGDGTVKVFIKVAGCSDYLVLQYIKAV